MEISEYSFIQLSSNIEDCQSCNCGNISLPVSDGNDIRFIFKQQYPSDVNVFIVDLNGKEILRTQNAYNQSQTNQYLAIDFSNISLDKFAIGDCFRVKIVYKSYGQILTYYTNSFVYIGCKTEGTTHCQYSFNENTLGFLGGNQNLNLKVRLPLIIKEPQFIEEDEYYKKLDGTRKLLFSTIDKEYILETEYLPQHLHDKIVVMLNADIKIFDGVDMVKTDKYDINHEEYILDDCGEKYIKATSKLQNNLTLRNCNCQ